MNFLGKLRCTSASTRLLTASLRNLSISSSSQPTTTTNNSFLFSTVDQYDFKLKPLIARQHTNLIKDVSIGGPAWRKKEILDLPLTNKIIENPTQISKVIEEITDKIIELPTNVNTNEDDTGKQAKNGMIMIRRRKMRKHKLRKLRKKMKYVWAKRRQRREYKKEKVFQYGLTREIKKAEMFSAEQYVADKIRAATEPVVTKYWNGRRLPEFLIKELKAEREQRMEIAKLKQWELLRKQN